MDSLVISEGFSSYWQELVFEPFLVTTFRLSELRLTLTFSFEPAGILELLLDSCGYCSLETVAF